MLLHKYSDKKTRPQLTLHMSLLMGLLHRFLLTLCIYSFIFFSVVFLIRKFVVDTYLIKRDKQDPPQAVITSDSDYDSEGNDTLHSFLDHTSFYQNLNSSSQYLRRDSFSQ